MTTGIKFTGNLPSCGTLISKCDSGIFYKPTPFISRFNIAYLPPPQRLSLCSNSSLHNLVSLPARWLLLWCLCPFHKMQSSHRQKKDRQSQDGEPGSKSAGLCGTQPRWVVNRDTYPSARVSTSPSETKMSPAVVTWAHPTLLPKICRKMEAQDGKLSKYKKKRKVARDQMASKF